MWMRLRRCKPGLLCRRCELFLRTGRTKEPHHFGGRPSPVVIDVDANEHAWLTLLQRGWRGRLEPGSLEAIFCDLLALMTVRYLRTADGPSS